MIESLKKYPETFKKFEEYMMKFENDEFCFYSDEINVYNDDSTYHDMKMPPQFLIGCLMEFLGENKINISVHSSIPQCVLLDIKGDNEAIVHPDTTSVFAKAFKILEERE